MSSLYIAFFRTPPQVHLVQTCSEVAVDLGWDKEPEGESKLAPIRLEEGNVAAIWVSALGLGPSMFYRAVGSRLQCPWIEVQQIEHVIWGYSLYIGDVLQDQFSTHAEIWGLSPDECRAYRGDVAKLAEIWGVDVEKISRYLRHWEQRAAWMSEKAYPGDRAGYGDCEQMWDFSRALGGHVFRGNEEPGLTIRVPNRL